MFLWSPREDLNIGVPPGFGFDTFIQGQVYSPGFPKVFTSILAFGVLYTVTWMNRDH